MKFLKIAGGLLAGLLTLTLIAGLIAVWVYRDIPREQLEGKYMNPESRFMNVAGARIHYRDEGPRDAPTVLLIHANFASLLGWEPWVEALKTDYRVVRFDMTSHGLTGPDPTGDYSLERTMELTEKFIDAVGLERFTIGGTSLGGTVSVLYTAANPERIESLILLSPGSIEGKEQQSNRGEVPASAYVLKYIMPRALPEFMLTGGFSDDGKLTDELIDRWFELWRYPGQREAQLDRLRQYDSGDIFSVYRSLDVPVLLLWGEDNQTAKFEQHKEILHLLENAPTINFFSYPGVGHMAVQEAGELMAPDVINFLAGDRETGLVEYSQYANLEPAEQSH